ncbi:hypothetical protein OK016_13970 [Vibrio chagasii]|nr:hypothetical protein [Vibrio chagasii]
MSRLGMTMGHPKRKIPASCTLLVSCFNRFSSAGLLIEQFLLA